MVFTAEPRPSWTVVPIVASLRHLDSLAISVQHGTSRVLSSPRSPVLLTRSSKFLYFYFCGCVIRPCTSTPAILSRSAYGLNPLADLPYPSCVLGHRSAGPTWTRDLANVWYFWLIPSVIRQRDDRLSAIYTLSVDFSLGDPLPDEVLRQTWSLMCDSDRGRCPQRPAQNPPERGARQTLEGWGITE